MTEREFRQSEASRNELQKLLEHPIMSAALKIIEDMAKPRRIPEPRLHAHLDTLTSQQYYRLLGIQSAVDTLRDMINPNPEGASSQSPEEEYFHSLPAQMQDATRQQREGKQQPD